MKTKRKLHLFVIDFLENTKSKMDKNNFQNNYCKFYVDTRLYPRKCSFFPLILIQHTKTDHTFEGKHQSHKNRKTRETLTHSSVLTQKCHMILQHGGGERADWIDTGQESTEKVHYREQV